MPAQTKLALGALLLGVSLIATSGLSPAQVPELPRVGFIFIGSPGPGYDALRQGLAQLDYVEDESVQFEPRFASEDLDKVPGFAKELVDLEVDAIVALGAVAVSEARALTSEIPIIFAAVIDPTAIGFAESMERPGGNITGITSFDPEQAAQQFEILKEVVPDLSRVAILSDGRIPFAEDGWNPIEKAYDTAARSLGLEPHWVRTKGTEAEFTAAFENMTDEQVQAAVIVEVPANLYNMKTITDLAAKHRLPAVFPARWPGASEGLISYGTSILNTVPRIPHYVAMVLKGADPAETPIEVAGQRELVVNLKTAKEIGVDVPSALIERADRVIQ